MRYGENATDEMCNELELLHEVELHDMAEIELWDIVSAISEAQEELGDAVKKWLFEATKTVLGEPPYDTSCGNGQFPSKGHLDGLLADPAGAFKAITNNLTISCNKTGEFKRLLINSGLTLQERTVVVLHYMHGKSELELSIITGYGDATGMLWTALVKIGHMLRNNKKQ